MTPQISITPNSNKHQNLQQKQAKAPQISEATLRSESLAGDKSESTEVQPVINFNGLKQVGYMVHSEEKEPNKCIDSGIESNSAKILEQQIDSSEGSSIDELDMPEPK